MSHVLSEVKIDTVTATLSNALEGHVLRFSTGVVHQQEILA